MSAGKKKKGAKRFFSFLAKVLAVVLVYEAAVWFVSDRVVRLTYNGLDNMFTVHDEYYAVAGPFRAPVPKQLVQTVCSDDVENIGPLSEETGKSFFVQANYSLNGRPVFEGTTTLIHPYSNKYVFEVTSPGPDKCEVSREEERILLDIAEHFFDFNTEYVKGEDNWVAMTGQSTTMFSFRIFMNGDEAVFVIHQPNKRDMVYSYKDGSFIKIMNVSEKGDFDVVIWK